MPRPITPATSVENLRKEAKRWLRAYRAGDGNARTRFTLAYPSAREAPTLRDVQHALAREYGHHSWQALTASIDAVLAEQGAARALLSADAYVRLANDLVAAFDTRDESALQRLNQHYERSFSFDDLAADIWRRVYAFRQRASREGSSRLRLGEAQLLIAQDTGYASWEALTDATSTGAPPVAAFSLERRRRRVSPRRQLAGDEWDRLIDVARRYRVSALDASGLMTDAVLARVASLDLVTTLSLAGSRGLTDTGLKQLARMPQLEHLELTGVNLTDAGLEVLRHLPNLKSLELTWHRGVTDAGASHVRHCERLERLNLMGTTTGDGVLAALAGKPQLRHLETGRLVTDDGLRRLHDLPRLVAPPEDPTTESGESGARLMIDGPFTDAGVAALAGLAGVVHLDLFWHASGITAGAFGALAGLPNLASLGADGALSTDAAFGHVAALPRLKQLRAQEAVATEAGFEALSRSQTLEGFWGRECPNFATRAFLAFSTLPHLRAMGVGCANVGDEALARFPLFPSLRELTPIGIQDNGFRHIGRCERLERLTCMYCRDTTDRATEHVADLRLRYYYAGLTRITDRSLDILANMASLELIEFYECNGITDAGVSSLARLPRLRELAVESCPGVTLAGTRAFSPDVLVRYST